MRTALDIRTERICGNRNMGRINASFSERMAFITDKRRRDINQDGLFIATGSRRVLAVADGLGGHYGGEVASQIAIETLEREIRADTSLQKSFERAHQEVQKTKKENGTLREMGTTLAAVEIFADHVEATSCGDSFIFLVGNGMGLLNLSHTYASLIFKEENRNLSFPFYNIEKYIKHMAELLNLSSTYGHLTSFIGAPGKVRVDRGRYPLHAGNRLLLCTDGLTNYLHCSAIAYALAEISDPEKIVSTLYSMTINSMEEAIAMDVGYSGDNITMALYEHGSILDF